ncbi:MAG: adenylate cyclase [Candidatus Yanofskybacteria bacterium]|nr:adenylate cyclase [Candidatus Yanofskybacteria bacterium]
MKEIERKFLVKKLPPGYNFSRSKIRQGYIVISPDLKSCVRLREERHLPEKGFKFRAFKEFTQTVKRGSGKVRDEFEIETFQWQFTALWPTTAGRRLEKTRNYFYDPSFYKGQLCLLDVFHKNLKGLILVEVEFNSEKEADAFVPLDWFGKEVTEDKRYSNQSLATHGLPAG